MSSSMMSQILREPPPPQSGRVVKDHASFGGHTVACCLSFRDGALPLERFICKQMLLEGANQYVNYPVCASSEMKWRLSRQSLTSCC